MSFTDDYLEAKKKKKKTTKTGNSFTDEYLSQREKSQALNIPSEEDIAPVWTPTPTKKKEENEERTWFSKGAFEDGYDFGDISRTIIGTTSDILEEVGTGVLGMGERVVDAGAYVAGGVGKMFGNDDFAEDTKKFIQKDLYDERKIAQSILSGGMADEFSVLGEKSDSLLQSAGQLGATIGLQALGVPWFVTSGLTSFGGEVEGAFNEGASYGEAGLSSAITAGAEILTEKISGGISFGGKTLDDALTKNIARNISNKTVRTLSKLGVDMFGEGAEEVLSGVMSAIGQKITYADDKELKELFSKEEAFESFVGGAVLGGGMSGANVIKSGVQGVDYASGLTANEEKVVNKVYNDRVAEEEKNGKITDKEKSKIYDEVLDEMEKGGISTDTIEEVLGGETYKNYQNTVKNEDSLRETFNQLNQMKQGEMTGEQIDLRNELKEQLKELESKGERNQLKSQLGSEVMSLVQGDRLIESYNERSRRGQAFEADLTKYNEKQKAVVQKAIDSGILNNTRRTHEFVDMVSKISADKGVLFDFANNQKLKDSGFAVEGKTVNGFVTKDGVTLNIDSAKSLNSVVGHEITHVLEGTELYTALQSAVTEYAKTKGDYQGRYDSLTKLYENIEGANVDAELTADLVGDYLFTDSDFINNLHTNNRNVFQKIYDEIKYLCKVATAGSKEARELEKVKRAFEKAYKADSKAESDTKYSVSDSSGKELTKEQQEYFKDSKVLDVDGNLKVMYQGGNGDFTVFDRKKSSYSNLYGRGFYFTDSESHAKQYGNARAFYLDIKNPVPTKERTITKDQMRNFLEAVAENEDDYSFENYGYGATVDSVLDSIYSGKSDFAMLYDVSQTAIGDMVEAVELFNEVNGTDFDGLILDTETVTFRSNQAKNTDNQKPTADADIRFSLSKSVEETKDLMALHNLQSSELLKTLDLGGLPMPSIAVIKADAGHDQYGDVSLILPKETIDPKANKDNKVYGGDAWTPVYPKIEYKPNEKVAKKIRDKYYGLANNIGYDAVRPMYSYVNELEDTLNRAGGEAAMLEKLYGDTDMMNVYLQDSGKGKVEPIVKETVTEISEAEAEMNQFLIDALDEDFVSSFKAPAGENPMKYRAALMEQHEPKIRDAYKRLFMEQYDFTEEEANNALDNTTKRDLMKIMREAYMYTQNKGVTVKTETDYNATREAIRNAASDGYKEWVDGLFKGVEGKSGIRNNQDYYTRSGNPRSWDALHWENTLENVVKVMKGQDDTGVDSFSPFNNLFGKAHKRYGSIAEIKADSNRLRKIPEEEYEALKDSFSARFAEIANSIKDPGERNPYIAADNAAELIVDAVSTQKTKSGMLNYLRKWNSRATAQTVDDVVSLVSDIANMPTGYFEAKPKRAVGFDEVGVFVIPNNIDVSVKQELLNRGYSIAEYDPNVEGDRTKVLNQFEEYKFSLSDVGAEPKTHGKYNVFGKDIALDSPTVSKTESVQESAPVVSAENATTTPESVGVSETESTTISPNDLAEIAKQARRESMRGAYNHNGKQYLSDGSFIAEFNTVDESLEQSKDFPIKQAVKELDEAFARQVEGNYDLHTSDTKGFVKVGNSLFGTKRVNALIRALENPVFSIAKVHGGHEALIVTADNGRAVLMPVRASGNAYLVYEAQPIADAATFPDDLAPMDDAYEEDRIASLDDADMPPETEAPYYEDDSEDMEAEDPFENRDWYEVSNRKVKAYMYDHPEVKPYFQAEAAVMLDELQNTTKGEKWYNDHLFYESGGEEGFGGTKRHTSDSIATMLDEWKMSYADIEKGLKAIIEDHGAENIAAAKKVEFMLNERLLDGYKSFTGYEPTMDRFGNVPQNQDYINMLAESQIVDAYSKESFEALMAEADKFAPPISEEIVEEMVETNIGKMPLSEYQDMVAQQRGYDDYADMRNQGVKFGNKHDSEDIAPVKETPKRMAFEAIRPKKEKQPRLVRATPEEQARANVLTEEPKVEKKKTSAWSLIRNNILDKGMIFEDLSLATGNRELQARWNTIRYADGKAQRFMEKNLKPIIQTVENSGKTPQFYEYLYHMHNADRMSLEQRYDDVPNKPVFGDGVTAQVSRDAARRLEKANPEFKVWAQDIYNYNRMNRELLVEGGVISREVADLWEEMYPHYVPIRRAGDTGLNINVPLDTGRTGVNAPIKRATGGSRDILPLFDTLGQRTMQTYKAVAKNRFGVELKNTLGVPTENAAIGLDEAIDSVDTHEELLQEGKNGKKPTFTVFENGEKVTFEITDEMYDAMKPKSKGLAYTNKVLNTANNIRRGLLTEYNPAFLLTNAIKDAQDVLINSQHPARTYANFPKAVSELFSKGHWYQEYIDNGGEQNTYFESETNTFAKEKSAIRKIVGFPLDKISDANNFIERVPRLAEYIASRKAGNSIDVSMLDSARVTTNFAAGGDLTKFLNRNGATFLNASVQGAMQQVRNVREAKANGLKGALTLAAKLAAAGLPAIMLNHLLWDDDEEYAELSDYVKQNYYIVGKYDDGKFVRIPKGRTLAVIQNGFEQMENLITGNDEVDIATFGELLISNLAPNNPLDNNIFAPIGQAWSNTTWYGDDLVPTRLQDLPAAEQYDETTDEISKWLGEKLNVSPYKLNYLLDQYSGGLGDTFLPMITPEAERGDNTLLAPIADKFTTDSVMKNQNVSDFYTKKDELAMNAKMSNATDEDVLMSKYMNSVNSELSELYKQKREIQNSDLPDEEKYEAVRDVQKEIVDLTKYGLDTYSDVSVYDEYATVGDRHYRRNKDGEWTKLADDQLEKQEEVTSGLGISAAEYWSNKDEYNFAYEKPEKYAVAKSVGGYTAYKDYTSQLYDIKGVDNDGDGRSDTGTRKEKVLDWINNLDADYGTRIILFKNEYNADDTYNYDIIEYLNSRQDISYEEEVTILKELGFDVSADGTISWD